MKTKQTVIALAMATSVALLGTACSPGGGDNNSGDNGPKAPDFTAPLSGSMTTGGFTLGDEVATSRADLATAKVKADGVTNVTINQANFDSQKFAAQAASGNVPDLVLMDRQYVATYASKGLIVPLDKCYEAQNVDPNKHYYPGEIADVTYDGNVYGIPQFLQPQGIIINDRVASAAGVTAADLDTSKPEALLAAAKKMYTESDGKPTRLGFDPQLPGQVSIWFLAFGGKIMDQNGKPTLNDPNNVKALTFLKELYDAQGGYENAYSFGQTWDFFGAKNQFSSDQVGAGMYAQWYPNVLSGFKDTAQVSGTPVNGPDGKPMAAAGGPAYVIPAKAKNPAAACAWAIANTSDDAWVAAVKARLDKHKDEAGYIFTGVFTGSQTADKIIRDQYIKPTGNEGFDKLIATYYDEMANVVAMGSSTAGLQIQTELQNAVVPAMTGKKTVQEALDGAQAAAMLAYTPPTK